METPGEAGSSAFVEMHEDSGLRLCAHAHYDDAGIRLCAHAHYEDAGSRLRAQWEKATNAAIAMWL